jgi:hypothetical protein
MQLNFVDAEQITGFRVQQSAPVGGLIVAAFQGTAAHQQGEEFVSSHVVPHNLAGELLKNQLVRSGAVEFASHGKAS